MKLRLYSTDRYTLHSLWLEPIVSEWLDLIVVDVIEFDKCDCYYTNQWDSWAQQALDHGKKVVIDRLWEPAQPYNYPDGCHVLHNWAWLWFNESLWYQWLGYDNYKPQPRKTHRALMPIRMVKPMRDYLINYLKPHLDEFIWSYQQRGKFLPNDVAIDHLNNQRYFDPDWYDCTAMTLVVETKAESNPPRPFVSEKTFKPMAYRHPFVVFGDVGTLQQLENWGFETFENLFDQSYDLIHNWRHRCQAVVQQCLDYKFALDHDHLTQEKLSHNHSRFFDRNLVTKKIQQEVLIPLLNYAET